MLLFVSFPIHRCFLPSAPHDPEAFITSSGIFLICPAISPSSFCAVPSTYLLACVFLSTIDMLRFLNLSFRYGPFAAGSCFQVINLGVTGKVDVLVVTNYKPMPHWALATAGDHPRYYNLKQLFR